MQPANPRDASFSPYHDEDRLSDFLDDDAQRLAANAAVVFLVHLGLVLSLSGSFIVPDLKPPPPPEAVTVEIVTFDPEPEPEPEPEVSAADRATGEDTAAETDATETDAPAAESEAPAAESEAPAAESEAPAAE